MRTGTLLVLGLLLASSGIQAKSGGVAVIRPPILDSVPCSSPSDAAFGTVKLRSQYAGPAIQMRVKVSGSYVYQDIGFTGNFINGSAADQFAATADTGTPPEFRYYDQCGNGNHSTFSTTNGVLGFVWSPTPLAKTSLRVGSVSMLYNNTTRGSTQQLVIPATVALNMDAFSTVFVGRTGGGYPARPNTIWELSSSASWIEDFFTSNGNNGANILEGNGTLLNYGPLETGPAVYMTIATPTTMTVINDETVKTITKATLSLTSNTGGYLGFTSYASGIGGNDSSQDPVAELFFNRTLSVTEQAAIKNYAYSLTYQPQQAAVCLTNVGDSISLGDALPFNNNWINQAINGAATPISKPVRLYNNSTNGATAEQILANISRFTSACGDNGISEKIAVVMAGTNSLPADTPAQALATLETIWTDMHNAGFKVVCATIPNNSNGTNVAGLNSLIQANYAANGCDVLADVWQNSLVGNGSNPLNTTYFFDGLHPTTAGDAQIAPYIAAAINIID